MFLVSVQIQERASSMFSWRLLYLLYWQSKYADLSSESECIGWRLQTSRPCSRLRVISKSIRGACVHNFSHALTDFSHKINYTMQFHSNSITEASEIHKREKEVPRAKCGPWLTSR